MNRNKHNL